MKYGPFSKTEIKREEQRRLLDKIICGATAGWPRRCDYAVKMASSFNISHLEQERDRVILLVRKANSKKTIFLMAYGIIEDKLWGLPVMKYVSNGENFRHYMDRNKVDLPADIADNVADFLVKLRGILQPIGDKVTLSGGWEVQGTMFHDNETFKMVTTIRNMALFITIASEKRV